MAISRRLVDRAIVVSAIACRVAAVWVLQSHAVPRSTYEHGEIAASILAGRGFSMRFLGADGPTSQQAPVYPALVALAYAAGGVDSPRSLLYLEIGQSILGGVLVLGILRLAREIAPDRPGIAWVAGALVAFHPTLIYAATHVQVASLGVTLLVWTLALAYRTGATGDMRSAALTGGLLALLVLTDPILALVWLGVAWAICLTSNRAHGRLRDSWRLLAVIGLTSAAGVAPWLVRNARVHGEFVAIKSTFGYAFWQGNCAISEGTDKVVRPSMNAIMSQTRSSLNLKEWNQALWDARHEAGYIDDIALTRDDYRLLGSVTEPERSRILFRRAWSEVTADPARYARLCLRRLRFFCFFDETNPKSKLIWYRAPHVGLTVLAVLGLALSGADLRRRMMPTIVVAAAIAVFHSLTIVSARFHIPIEPLMTLWAAAGLAEAAHYLRLKDGFANRSAPHGHHIIGIGVERGFAVLEGVDRSRVT